MSNDSDYPIHSASIRFIHGTHALCWMTSTALCISNSHTSFLAYIPYPCLIHVVCASTVEACVESLQFPLEVFHSQDSFVAYLHDSHCEMKTPSSCVHMHMYVNHVHMYVNHVHKTPSSHIYMIYMTHPCHMSCKFNRLSCGACRNTHDILMTCYRRLYWMTPTTLYIFHSYMHMPQS